MIPILTVKANTLRIMRSIALGMFRWLNLTSPPWVHPWYNALSDLKGDFRAVFSCYSNLRFFLTFATFLKIVSFRVLSFPCKILHSTTTETVSLLNAVGFKGQISEPMIPILTVKANTLRIMRSIALGMFRWLNLTTNRPKVTKINFHWKKYF